ncbi:MAG: 3-phosphoshikimate 1-carboxyvinyltransferase [Rhodospirillaceae bacterium]|jgi:3-phosphoshikimate 1-carboxyvinyltransferase|nr:3-phosphoshikimate 1-carboxyvinyltransferase [Rhodospirillaceae bacterium]
MSIKSLISFGVTDPLVGKIRVPGDKSISHRAVILCAMAIGQSSIEGLLESDDVLRTIIAMRALGIEIIRIDNGYWILFGRGIGGLSEPDDVINLGNSGTGARLLMGLLASYNFTTMITGDDSLRLRPMRRVIEPLGFIGCEFICHSDDKMPLSVIGTALPIPITYELQVSSAQVKSAILLAGLNIPGITTVIENVQTRDHTEIMLKSFGAKLLIELLPNKKRKISIVGQPELKSRVIKIPGDPSSAAFLVAACLLIDGSEIKIVDVGNNSLRSGFYQTLIEMGACINFSGTRFEIGEPIADLMVRNTSMLSGVDISHERAPTMIDEYPILAIIAAFANGTTRMRGLSELRVKESDRLIAIVKGLDAVGVKSEIEKDDLIIYGTSGFVRGGATIKVNLDHRIAMSFLIMGMASQQPIRIDDASTINTSFPNFVKLMNELGAKISED